MAIQEQGAAMRIGEVARKLNLSTSAIRYYEKQGLMPRQTECPASVNLTTILSSGYALYRCARQLDLASVRFVN